MRVLALILLALSGTVTFPSLPPRAANLPFATDRIEHFLTPEQIVYIQPGLQIQVNSVTIPDDRRPVVDLTFTDSLGQPLDRLGRVIPGPISASFVLSWYDPATRNYTSYITRVETAPADAPHPGATAVQATADSGGTWTDLQTGHSVYKFGKALPADYDPTKTTTLGIYATRNLTDIEGKNEYANTEYDFRPDGQPVAAVWDEINQSSSCNTCHNPLMAHGGARQDVKLCVLCHSPQSSDAETGNTVDFKVMIHKIHDGANLPSVQAGMPYQIWGFNNAVNDFSTVVFPQDIRDCDKCHVGEDPNHVPAQAFAFLTAPARAACGSCHDNIDWATGANHPGGPQANDVSCARCHIPASGTEWDASVQGAHTVPAESSQLKGLIADIVSVGNTNPGQHPTAVFAIRNGDGTPVDGTKLSTFAPILGGPTTSYATSYRENALSSSSYDAASGTTAYTFQHTIPADATGTWTVSADLYRNVSLQRADGQPPIAFREAAFNPIHNAAVTDPTPVPRRMVVDVHLCDSCHDRLAAHGDQRLNPQECVICHNPLANDSDQRPASENPPESISFQRLIHRIHSGENLTQDFTVFGFGGTPHNFNEVRFPADRRDCANCHVDATYTIPLAAGIDPVITLRDYFSPQGPVAAACLGCHDDASTAAHAYLNTTTLRGQLVEACATCHGRGAEFDVAKVHAR